MTQVQGEVSGTIPEVVLADDTETDNPPAVGPRHRRRWSWGVYLAILPAFVVLGLFAYYPAINGFVFSFFDWRPGFESIFIGGDNYLRMMGDELWWGGFRNLGIIFIVSITLWWVFPFAAAELLLSVRNPRTQFVFRTLLIVPLAFPGVVTTLVWQFMLSPNDGVINNFLGAIGLADLAQNWLGQSSTALASLLFIGFPWIATLPFLVFLSSLQNIPTEVHDAASLDGAGPLRRIVSIDIPMIASQIRLLLFLAVVFVLQFGFTAFILTKGGPNNATQVPILRMLGVAFQGSDWGYAAALSTVLFVIIFVFSIVVLMAGRKRGADV